MEPCPVVDFLDEIAAGGGRLLGVPVLGPVYLFVFQGLEEALRLGIVIGVALPGHADAQPRVGEQFDVLIAGVLHARSQ